MPVTKRVSGTIAANATKRVGTFDGTAYDTWGGAWDDAWGSSWFRPTPLSVTNRVSVSPAGGATKRISATAAGGVTSRISPILLLLEGDAQSNGDHLRLEGDMQSGDDVLKLEGDAALIIGGTITKRVAEAVA